MTPNPMQQIRELAKKWSTACDYNTGFCGKRLLAILDNPDWVCVPREPVWVCTRDYFTGCGGITHSRKYAKSYQDMLILKDQGYECELITASGGKS